MDWSGEFPVFENGLIPLQAKQKMPKGTVNRTGKDGFFPNGNFTFEETFSAFPLDFRWIGLRGPREDFIAQAKKGGLEITPFATDIKEVRPTSTLFYRQQHRDFAATTTLKYDPKAANELAGITCYQNEKFNYVFGITRKEGKSVLLLAKTERGNTTVVARAEIDTDRPVSLRVEGKGNDYRFSYATDGGSFTNLGGTMAGDILSTDVAGGFTGALIGLYATTGNSIQP